MPSPEPEPSPLLIVHAPGLLGLQQTNAPLLLSPIQIQARRNARWTRKEHALPSKK